MAKAMPYTKPKTQNRVTQKPLYTKTELPQKPNCSYSKTELPKTSYVNPHPYRAAIAVQ